MKDIVAYINEDKFNEYLTKAAEHIIDTLKDYIDDLTSPEKYDEDYGYWVRFKSSIKKSDLSTINKELRKVLASHEVTGSEDLYVNVFKEPQLSIIQKDNEYIVYFKGKVLLYWRKNIQKK